MSRFSASGAASRSPHPSHQLSSHPHALRWFLLCLAAALLWHWPASSLDQLVYRLSQQHLRLANAHGRIFQGQAMLLVHNQRQWQRLQAIRWQLHGKDLLRGQIHITLDAAPGQLDIRLDTHGYAFQPRQLHLDAAGIAPLLPAALGRYGWQGQLEFNSNEAYVCTWSAGRCQGKLDILWQNAGIRQLGSAPLGDYVLQIQAENQADEAGQHLQLRPLRGRLELSGQGYYASRQGLNFRGLARLTSSPAKRTAADDELLSLLNTLGRRQSDGSTLLEYRQTR